MTIRTPAFLNLKKKPGKKLGLDIGSYNLKVAEIQIKGSSLEIVGLGMKDIRESTDLSSALQELLKETKITAKEANISLSGENVVARHISLPRMDEQELKKAMWFELEDHIPFKAEEVYFDYYVLGPEPNAKNRMRVFLVATKKEQLDTRVMLIRQAGLEPRLITMDALALMNTFYANYPEKNLTNISLLNIGDKITNLLIMREHIPYFVRDTRFGGEAITALLQTKLELDKKGAEKLKYNLGKTAGEVTQIIKTALINLLNEIFVSLDFYENLTEQRIDEIYVSGGSAQLVGLKEFLSGYLNLEIFDLDPYKNFSLSPNISPEKAKEIAPYMAVAIGLALEEP